MASFFCYLVPCQNYVLDLQEWSFQLETDNVKPGKVIVKALDKLHLLLHPCRICVFYHVNTTATEVKSQSVKYEMVENENLVGMI